MGVVDITLDESSVMIVPSRWRGYLARGAWTPTQHESSRVASVRKVAGARSVEHNVRVSRVMSVLRTPTQNESSRMASARKVAGARSVEHNVRVSRVMSAHCSAQFEWACHYRLAYNEKRGAWLADRMGRIFILAGRVLLKHEFT
eukprot:COSAG02_NODE_7720_length_2875_cov_209.079251_3_plen_145_part_00